MKSKLILSAAVVVAEGRNIVNIHLTLMLLLVANFAITK